MLVAILIYSSAISRTFSFQIIANKEKEAGNGQLKKSLWPLRLFSGQRVCFLLWWFELKSSWNLLGIILRNLVARNKNKNKNDPFLHQISQDIQNNDFKRPFNRLWPSVSLFISTDRGYLTLSPVCRVVYSKLCWTRLDWNRMDAKRLSLRSAT